MSNPGIYVPDNAALADHLADSIGEGLRPDHPALLLHFIGQKRYMSDLDKRGYARLNANVLRGWIHPRDLGYVKKFLRDRGVLQTAPHSAGNFPIGFRVTSKFDGPPRRHALTCPSLAAKMTKYRREHKGTGDDDAVRTVIDRRRPLLNHQRDTMAALAIPDTPAALAKGLSNKADPAHIAYVAQCIQHHDDDGLTVDGFGWRAHSLITRTSSHLRPLLLLDGLPVAEVDVANSQPLLVAILVQHIKRWNNIMEVAGASPPSLPADRCGIGSSLGLCVFLPEPRVPQSETRSFLEVCQAGTLYSVLARDCDITREKAKHEVFRDVLFGKAHVNGRITRAFTRRWPVLIAWIRQAKRECGYKIIAQALQRLESVIMLDGIGSRLLREFPNLPFLTIHDSAMLVADKAQAVKRIMKDEFIRWGATPTIRVKCRRDDYKKR